MEFWLVGGEGGYPDILNVCAGYFFSMGLVVKLKLKTVDVRDG